MARRPGVVSRSVSGIVHGRLSHPLRAGAHMNLSGWGVVAGGRSAAAGMDPARVSRSTRAAMRRRAFRDEGWIRPFSVLGLASGTLALSGAGKLSLDEVLHQRLGGGRLALFSAVFAGGCDRGGAAPPQLALAERAAAQTAATAPSNDTVDAGPAVPDAPSGAATSSARLGDRTTDTGPAEA